MSDSTLIREHDPFSGHRNPAEPVSDANTSKPPEPTAPVEPTPAVQAAPKVEKAPPKRRAPRRRRVSKAEAEAAAREVSK